MSRHPARDAFKLVLERSLREIAPSRGGLPMVKVAIQGCWDSLDCDKESQPTCETELDDTGTVVEVGR